MKESDFKKNGIPTAGSCIPGKKYYNPKKKPKTLRIIHGNTLPSKVNQLLIWGTFCYLLLTQGFMSIILFTGNIINFCSFHPLGGSPYGEIIK